MDRGAWQAVVHAVTLSRTRLRDWTTLRSRECYPGGCICSQFLDGEGRGELAKRASGELWSRTTWPSHSGGPLHPLLRTPVRGLASHLITQDLQPEVPQPGLGGDAGAGLTAVCVLLVTVIGGRTCQSESFPDLRTSFSSPSGLIITKALVKEES